MTGTEQIKVFDTTLRDGEQSPGCSMTADEKLRMAHQLDRLGVDVIEAGFPISSEGDFHSVQLVAREIRRPVIAALARCCHADIERAWQALKAAAHPRIHTFLATSDIHLHHKLKLSRRECMERARDAVSLRQVSLRGRRILAGGRYPLGSGFPLRSSCKPQSRPVQRQSTFPIPWGSRSRLSLPI